MWQNKGELPGILKRIELFFIKPSGKRISCKFFSVLFWRAGFLTPRDSCWCFVEDPGIPNTSSSISITETWCLDLQKKTWGKHRCDPIRMVRIDPRLNRVVWMFVGGCYRLGVREYGSTTHLGVSMIPHMKVKSIKKTDRQAKDLSGMART